VRAAVTAPKDVDQELGSRDDDARFDSARQALSALLGRDGVIRPAVPSENLLPEMIGTSEPMRELTRLIRLVAPRSTTVLIEGETGTGKEVVARALHRLSNRAGKPFVVLNCAAIPEALLEAELFGHTRGAFTGAVQSRTGRIEAAHGGTLFLDEIGEMPMALQAKMLRFLECGELQRVGDNETMRVDVRVIAATHQPLEKLAMSIGAERTFRLDLYHRLAVFPVEVPPVRERMEDVGLLVEHFLEQMGEDMPRKRLTDQAEAKLYEHNWPGNVRELMHVLERGAILAGDRMEIGAEEIRFRRATRW
jgi:transcriptional regulator with GAF, ATPase, and Fis domain